MSPRRDTLLTFPSEHTRKDCHAVNNKATGLIDIIDDANALIGRLETLEHLLFKCMMDLPFKGCHFENGIAEGYDGSEILSFLDESLCEVIKEFKGQLKKCNGLHQATKDQATDSKQANPQFTIPVKRVA